VENATGLTSILEARRTFSYDTSKNGSDYVSIFLNQRTIKKALKAEANVSLKRCKKVLENRMHVDSMKSMKWLVEMLLKQMLVLLYQGQFDLGLVVSTEEWKRSVDWSGLSEFWSAERRVWRVWPVLAGSLNVLKFPYISYFASSLLFLQVY
ncbi:hypothetical protein KI387_018580, partial [Taxus chinensis]